MTPETILEHDGIQQPIIEWALDYGITPAIIIARIGRGLSVADAITRPMATGHKCQRLPVYSDDQRNTRSALRSTVTSKRLGKGAAFAPPSLSCPDKKSSAGED